MGDLFHLLLLHSSAAISFILHRAADSAFSNTTIMKKKVALPSAFSLDAAAKRIVTWNYDAKDITLPPS